MGQKPVQAKRMCPVEKSRTGTPNIRLIFNTLKINYMKKILSDSVANGKKFFTFATA